MKKKNLRKSASTASTPSQINLEKASSEVDVGKKQKASSPEKWYHSWERARVVIYCTLCLLFTFSLAGSAWYLEAHPPAKPVPVAVKKEPQCAYVSTYEVKDAAGKVVSHRTQTQQGDCVQKEIKPFEFPLWAKILFYTFVVAICLCGGWEILIVFFI